MPDSTPITILCVASEVKGVNFIREGKRNNCRMLVLTREKYRDGAWPFEDIDEMFAIPELNNPMHVIYTVSYLARTRQIDTIVPMDDFDVEMAAILREHMQLPGLGQTVARHFRDKFAMRTQAKAGGISEPEFIGIFNRDRLAEFMGRVPGPWVLKPRFQASSMGIKKINHPDELWLHLDQLGDEQSFFVLEQFIPGDVFHVDGLVDNGEVLFSIVHQYGQPPLNVYQGGGVFITRTLDRDSQVAKDLTEINERTIKALGLNWGATHAEFIRSHADGQYYFLECAARVGGANIAEAVTYASGIDLWTEWAKLEVGHARGTAYQLPEARQGYAGVINCLSRQEYPDLSSYDEPEIVVRLNKRYHAGLVVSSTDAERVKTLLDTYQQRFAEDFLAVMPPLDKLAN
jgi:biotin carboxylase